MTATQAIKEQPSNDDIAYLASLDDRSDKAPRPAWHSLFASICCDDHFFAWQEGKEICEEKERRSTPWGWRTQAGFMLQPFVFLILLSKPEGVQNSEHWDVSLKAGPNSKSGFPRLAAACKGGATSQFRNTSRRLSDQFNDTPPYITPYAQPSGTCKSEICLRAHQTFVCWIRLGRRSIVSAAFTILLRQARCASLGQTHPWVVLPQPFPSD